MISHQLLVIKFENWEIFHRKKGVQALLKLLEGILIISWSVIKCAGLHIYNAYRYLILKIKYLF